MYPGHVMLQNAATRCFHASLLAGNCDLSTVPIKTESSMRNVPPSLPSAKFRDITQAQALAAKMSIANGHEEQAESADEAKIQRQVVPDTIPLDRKDKVCASL